MADDEVAAAAREALHRNLSQAVILGRPVAVDTEMVGRALAAAADAAIQKALQLGHPAMTLAEAHAEIERGKTALTAVTAERDGALADKALAEAALAAERSKGG